MYRDWFNPLRMAVPEGRLRNRADIARTSPLVQSSARKEQHEVRRFDEFPTKWLRLGKQGGSTRTLGLVFQVEATGEHHIPRIPRPGGRRWHIRRHRIRQSG